MPHQWTRRIGHMFSADFLTSRFMLGSLFAVNLLGTAYGYAWYWHQLEWTAAHRPLWMLVLVPDSPTASLFFTLSLACLLWARRAPGRSASLLRGLSETVGAVASVKYGIWAVVMILAGAAQGDPLGWQDEMLSVSHLGMAAEALLYVRFFDVKPAFLWLAACWTFVNDFVDYDYGGVYPWLPEVLEDDLAAIALFTVCLSAASLAVIYFVHKRTAKMPV